MKIPNLFRIFFWKILNLLPEYVSEQFVRDRIKINEKELEGFTIKVANTQDEFDQGYKLLYKCYLNQGYQNAHPHFPLRVTKYHIMPTSTMFIVKDKDVVVGTVTHVIDSRIGLPADKAVDISTLRKTKGRIAEISALAVDKEYRHNNTIIFALTRIVYHFSVQYAGCDAWVICVSSYIDLYYRALFFFKRIPSKEFKYDFVNGIRTTSLVVDLNKLPILFEHFYGGLVESKNLYQFYVQESEIIFKDFPESIIRGASTPTLTVAMIEYFFKDNTSIWASLAEQERTEVINAYYDESLVGLNDAMISHAKLERRSSARRLTNIRAELVNPVDTLVEFISCSIVSVSDKGFLLKIDSMLETEGNYRVLIQATPNLKLPISFQVLRLSRKDYFSCQVCAQDMVEWKKYYRKIEEFCLSFRG